MTRGKQTFYGQVSIQLREYVPTERPKTSCLLLAAPIATIWSLCCLLALKARFPSLGPVPRRGDAALTQVTDDLLKGRRREVEVVAGAPVAAVDDADNGGATLVGDANLAVAGALGVEDGARDGDDSVAVAIGLAACTEAGIEVGDAAGVVADLEGVGRVALGGSRKGNGEDGGESRKGGSQGDHIGGWGGQLGEVS